MSNRPNRRAPASVRVAAARGQSSNRTVWILVGAIVVVLFAAVIAVAARGNEEPVEGGGPSPSGGTVVPSGDLSYGDVEVTDATGAAAAVGSPGPTVAGVSFDDSPIKIAPDGKPKIVMLLAHWCPHCQAEVPRIQEWLDTNGMPNDVELFAVATGTSSSRENYPPGDWLREEGWAVPTLVDDEQGTAGKAFGLSSFPFFVVVDASGTVVYRTSGELAEAQWEGLLEAARTGAAPDGGGDGDSSPAG